MWLYSIGILFQLLIIKFFKHPLETFDVDEKKRCSYLCTSRPAYQGELTALEIEIEQLWDQYVLRYRCVEALKHQLSVLESAQAEVSKSSYSM